MPDVSRLTGTDLRGKTFMHKLKKLHIKLSGNKCKRCESVEQIEMDHIVPKIFGGPDTFENTQLLCKKCHIKKSYLDWYNPLRATKKCPMEYCNRRFYAWSERLVNVQIFSHLFSAHKIVDTKYRTSTSD